MRMQTLAMITGAEPAPWELEGTKQEILRRLGSLKRPVLGLLERSPGQRLPVEHFLEACCRVLALTSETNTYTLLSESSAAPTLY